MVKRAKHPGGGHLAASVRRLGRWDLIITLVLLTLPWMVLVMVRLHHLDPDAMVGVIFGLATVSVGLPTLWLTWLIHAPGESGSATMSELANELANAVRSQWTDESGFRRLNDPWPLPVTWNAADPSLADDWDSLVRLATDGVGWPPAPSAGIWADGPDELVGKDGELAGVLGKVPTGRLVVLGEPGSGKPF